MVTIKKLNQTFLISPEMNNNKYQKFMVTIALRLGIPVPDTQEDIKLSFSDGEFDNYGAEGRSENFVGTLTVNGTPYDGKVKVCTMRDKNNVINTLWPIHNDTEKQQQAKNNKTDDFINWYLRENLVLTTEEIANWYHPIFLDNPGLSHTEMVQTASNNQLLTQRKSYKDKSDKQKARYEQEKINLKQKYKSELEEAERKNQEKATLKETNFQKLKEMNPEVDWNVSLSTTAVFDRWDVEGDFLCVYLLSQSHPIRLKNTFRYDYPEALSTVKELKPGDMISYDTKGVGTFGSAKWFYKIRREDGNMPSPDENIQAFKSYSKEVHDNISNNRTTLSGLSPEIIEKLKEDKSHMSSETIKIENVLFVEGSVFSAPFNQTWYNPMQVLETDKGWFVDGSPGEYGGTVWIEGEIYSGCRITPSLRGNRLPHWIQKRY